MGYHSHFKQSRGERASLMGIADRSSPSEEAPDVVGKWL